MNDKEPPKRTTERAINARELARLIRRISHLFGAGDLGNYRTSDALGELAEYLEKLGPITINSLIDQVDDNKKRVPLPHREELRSLSLEEVQNLIDSEGVTKAELIAIGRSRFGIPQARLNRTALPEVKEELRAALGHERSLEYIQRNAEISGKARRS